MAPVPETEDKEARKAAVKAMRDKYMRRALSTHDTTSGLYSAPEAFKQGLAAYLRTEGKIGDDNDILVVRFGPQALSRLWDRLDTVRGGLEREGVPITDAAIEARLSDKEKWLHGMVNHHARLQKEKGTTIAEHLKDAEKDLHIVYNKRMQIRHTMVAKLEKQIGSDPNRELIKEELYQYYSKNGLLKDGGNPVESMVDAYLEKKFIGHHWQGFGYEKDYADPPDYGRELLPTLDKTFEDMAPEWLLRGDWFMPGIIPDPMKEMQSVMDSVKDMANAALGTLSPSGAGMKNNRDVELG